MNENQMVNNISFFLKWLSEKMYYERNLFPIRKIKENNFKNNFTDHSEKINYKSKEELFKKNFIF